MIRLKELSKDVYQADEPIIHFSREDVADLREGVSRSARKRIRVCAHKSSDEPLQEMLLAFAKGSYIRPSKHLGKQESLHVLEGRGLYVYFDDQGEITKVVPLGDYGSGRSFYLRTPDSIYHMLIVESDVFIIHEVTQGPFRRADTVNADWSPEDGSPDAIPYIERVLAAAKSFPKSRLAGGA